MGRLFSVVFGVVLVCYAVIGGGEAAARQAVLPSDQSLRAEQRRLADALFDDPANLDLMFAHANVSIELSDYEAAITTLERLLIYEQDLSRVRLELGVAYFNLGSYSVSELYFKQALADPEIDAATQERIAAYLSEIGRRTAENRLDFVANLGLTYASNANLGPADDTVTIGGVPGFVLSPPGRSTDDFGVRVLIYGTHRYDLGRPNDDAWITNATFFGVRYFEINQGNVASVRLRTGPKLNLTAVSGGAQIRPYAEIGYLNSGDETVYIAGFGGAELTVPFDTAWTGFADLNAVWLEYSRARVGQDRLGIRGTAGVTYQPTRVWALRLSGLVEHYVADDDFNSSTEAGVRVSGSYRYDIGLDFIDQLWAFSAYADARTRRFDQPDPFIDPFRTRRDYDLRGGISHLFAISDGFGVQLDLEGFQREANIQNFDLNNVSLTLSAQYRF